MFDKPCTFIGTETFVPAAAITFDIVTLCESCIPSLFFLLPGKEVPVRINNKLITYSSFFIIFYLIFGANSSRTVPKKRVEKVGK